MEKHSAAYKKDFHETSSKTSISPGLSTPAAQDHQDFDQNDQMEDLYYQEEEVEF